MSRDLEPWEIPPDESYWQALLTEGEYNRHDDGGVLGESQIVLEKKVPVSVKPEPDSGQGELLPNIDEVTVVRR